MARYTDSTCRLCRRESIKLYLKGDRCYTPKCALERRNYAPGIHGKSRKKSNEYGLQLREKQKTRRMYGVLETQFHNYFVRAERMKGIPGENLLQLLERRLDNVVYRLGLASSRVEARQLVRHGHFRVNGKKVSIPSYIIRIGDTVEVAEKSKESPKLIDLLERAAEQTPPPWLEYDRERVIGKVLAFPTREQIDVPVQEHLIVELYSK